MNSNKVSVYSFLILGVLGLFACKADNFEADPLSSFVVTNAAPASPSVDVLVDNIVTSAARLPFGATTISRTSVTSVYLPIREGDRTIKISPDSGKLNLVDMGLSFIKGKIYTIFVYDTLVNNKLKSIRLEDDLGLPATGNAKVRYLHFAPALQAVDIVFARGTTDSITVANRSYVGNVDNPDVTALSKFVELPAGAYSVKVKAAGTQNVLLSSAATIAAGRIYTFYARGGVKSVTLSTGQVTNF